MCKKQNKPETHGYLIVPNTLENRPYGWCKNNPDITCTVLSDWEITLLVVKTTIFEDIDDATDLLIGAYEEEEIPYDKLDISLEIVEKKLRRVRDPELRNAILKFWKTLRLAKEKKTLVAIYL